MAKDKFVGLIMVLVSLAGIAVEGFFLIWEPLQGSEFDMNEGMFWALAIPVFLGSTLVLAIAMWIGWTMATTPPPEPISLEEFEELDAGVKTEETPAEKPAS